MQPWQIIIGVILILLSLWVGRIKWLLNRLPRHRPETFTGRAAAGQTLVVCAGDSLTQGNVSANYVRMLRQRFAGQGYEFINAGVNGRLAYNLLMSLDAIIACEPDVVTVLIGSNDVNATLTEAMKKEYIADWDLPQDPTPDWYAENLRRIVARLKAETKARIILISPPVLGEAPENKANQRVAAYTTIVQAIAISERCDYIPYFETLRDSLKAREQAGPAYHGHEKVYYQAIMLKYSFLLPWNTISRIFGFTYLTDHIHLNEKAATLLTEMIAADLDQVAL